MPVRDIALIWEVVYWSWINYDTMFVNNLISNANIETEWDKTLLRQGVCLRSPSWDISTLIGQNISSVCWIFFPHLMCVYTPVRHSIPVRHSSRRYFRDDVRKYFKCLKDFPINVLNYSRSAKLEQVFPKQQWFCLCGSVLTLCLRHTSQQTGTSTQTTNVKWVMVFINGLLLINSVLICWNCCSLALRW